MDLQRRIERMTIRASGWAVTLTLFAAFGAGCGSSNDSTGTGGAGGGGGGAAGGSGGQTLYAKYGAAIPKVVDDAVAGVLADCAISPYFAVVGTSGHDTADRIKSCLRLQFTVLMGGPGTYPGVNDMGQTCVSMAAIHAGLGIPGAVFDKFVADLGGVLAADGVSMADVSTIAGAVMGTKTDIVSSAPVDKSACDAGASD
jgi:hypothetical protein